MPFVWTKEKLVDEKGFSRQKATSRKTVVGYHLVCRPEEKGVTRNADGTVWSGAWVIAEKQAERLLRAGAYVALHASHGEPSYLHGIIKAYRRNNREAATLKDKTLRHLSSPLG
jgi:hypothetical protein